MFLVVALALLLFCGLCCPPSTAEDAPSCFDMSVFSNGAKAQKYGKLCKSVSKTVIVMSHGRSGSTFISDVLSRNLIGPTLHDSYMLSDEILGTTLEMMKAMRKKPLDAVRERICMRGMRFNYTGFKWKPLVWNDAYLEALRWVAYHRIPVVYNYRNPIDVYLSAEKYRQETERSMASHCKAGDKACLNAHLQNQLIHVKSAHMIKHLNELTCLDDTLRYLLKREKVKFMRISLEKMTPEYSNGTTVIESWRKVLNFVDPAANWKNLNMQSLTPHFVATSSTSHRDKIRNYDEIKKVLNKTRFGWLLN